MHSNEIKNQYANWRDDIKAKNYNPSIIDRIFLRPEILHLTILMMPLDTDEKVEMCR